jgi:hypothetical protein
MAPPRRGGKACDCKGYGETVRSDAARARRRTDEIVSADAEL